MADDGYIRLTYTAFLQLRFQPHMAWGDDELRDELLRDGFPIHRAGYCEWTSPTGPVGMPSDRLISLGWTWMESPRHRILLVPHSIQSNVMLIADDRTELGSSMTHELLSQWLDAQAWQGLMMQWLGDVGRTTSTGTAAGCGRA